MKFVDRFLATLALLCTSLLLVGCLGSSEMANIQSQFERDHPEAQFDREVAVGLGPLTLDGLWHLTRLGNIPRLRPLITSLEGVKVGVYSVDGDLSPEPYSPDFLTRMVDRGWRVAARHQDPPEQSWLLYKPRGERVREFYVMRLEEDQLVVLRLRGDAERIIATVLSERNWNLDAGALRVIP